MTILDEALAWVDKRTHPNSNKEYLFALADAARLSATKDTRIAELEALAYSDVLQQHTWKKAFQIANDAVGELQAEVEKFKTALRLFPDMCNGEPEDLRLAADKWWWDHGNKALNGDKS